METIGFAGLELRFLHSKETTGGSLDLDMPETKIFVDAAGYADRIDVVNNGGTYSCAVQPFQEAEGRSYDWSTIDRNPPTVIGCATTSARAD